MSNENIKQKVNQTMYMNGGNTLSEKSAFRLGAEFGYSLAQQEIKERDEEIIELKRSILSGLKIEGEQKQEIERLKELIETAYITGRNDEKSKSEIIGWQQFKTKVGESR